MDNSEDPPLTESPRSMADQFFNQTGVNTMWSIDELVQKDVPNLAFLPCSVVDMEVLESSNDRGFIIDDHNMQ